MNRGHRHGVSSGSLGTMEVKSKVRGRARTRGGGMVDPGWERGRRAICWPEHVGEKLDRERRERLRLLRSTASVFHPSCSRLALRVGWGPLQCQVM